jgi:sigma-B regulation protein RsbU (phosphoserine phosphatase)
MSASGGNGERTTDAPALTRHIPLETLQSLQQRFARLGQMSVCICDAAGRPITEPTWGSQYSRLIGDTPRGRREFHDALGLCAARTASKCAVLAHEGMRLYAAPILHKGHRLAHIVVGTRPAETPPPDVVRAAADTYGLHYDELLAAAPPEYAWTGGTPDAINAFADMLAETFATLYAQGERIGRQLADLRVVHSLADLLSGTLDLQQLLDLTVRRVVQVMPVKACAIRLLNQQSGELVVKAVYNLSEEYLSKGPVIVSQNRIDAAAFAGETVFIEDAPNDPRIRYRENARREGIVSGLCVPMTYRGDTIGVMRVYTGQRYLFNESEAQLLRSIASQAAAAVINARLFSERAETERVQRQLDAAAQIQRRMLPPRPAPRAGLDFGCVNDPTLEVGGDFYDFLDLPAGHFGVCIADVVGKGLPAALLMASARSALRAYATDSTTSYDGSDAVDLCTIVRAVNRHMERDTLTAEFVTLFLAAFSPDGKALTYCNAGHAAPLLLRDGRFIELTVGGMVLGISADENFEQDAVALRGGDLLVMVTDGVTEAMDFEGRAYGWDRLRTSIVKHRDLATQQLALQLLWDVRRFAGLAHQSDDITIVVAKVG